MAALLNDTLIHSLASTAVQHYLVAHEHDDGRKLVLQRASLFNIPTPILADQLSGRKKAKEKLPSYYSANGIVYPPSINLEQCSSEATGRLKADIAKGFLANRVRCADLTGGLGVDSYCFSKVFNEVHHVEPDQNLHIIARHNHKIVEAKNIYHHCLTAENFLQQSNNAYDLIYLDPSRRDKGNKKVFRLSDCEPDVIQIIDCLFKASGNVLIKASPLIDISLGLQELGYVCAVYVLSVKNECKEILFLCQQGFTGEPVIHAVNLQGDQKEIFSFAISEEKEAASNLSEPLTYLYEPNASILKGGAFKLIAARYALAKLHVNTHLYTAAEYNAEFPGRVFKVGHIIKADPAIVGKYFPNKKANIITRNFPLSAVDLGKKLRLKDGGDQYLVAFSGEKRKYVVVADRVN
ncbi:MAG: hypothetical protein KF687_02120 [Cyclobacteriaceae bacterium]|nr:hypothetical protein [Cyclobacteriaceae bacterium]